MTEKHEGESVEKSAAEAEREFGFTIAGNEEVESKTSLQVVDASDAKTLDIKLEPIDDVLVNENKSEETADELKASVSIKHEPVEDPLEDSKDDSEFDENEEASDIDVDEDINVDDYSPSDSSSLLDEDTEEFDVINRKRKRITKPNGQSDDNENENTNDQEVKVFEFDGMTIEQKGIYSKCPKCLKDIKSTFIFRHIKQHDVEKQKFKCPERCSDLTFTRINNLFRHLRIVHRSKKPFMCKHQDCLQRFPKSNMLREHLARHRAERRKAQDEADEKEDGERFECEFPGCNKTYGKKHHLKEHERKHTGDMRYPCEVCGKKFYIQAHMKRHMYSHTGLKPHVCRWKCGLTFASYGGRMKHERITHYEDNPLQTECDICGRPFKNQQQLTKHRMTHLNPSERQEYRCSFCNIMLDSIKLRIKHEERHKDGDTFSCQDCNRSFKNEKNLNHHVKMHHTPKEEENSPAAKKRKIVKKNKNKNSGDENITGDQGTKIHPCHLCSPTKLFCLTSLRRHLARIHSENFKCEKCGKGFQEEQRYKSHMEIHRFES